MAVELAVLCPLIVLLILVVVACGRLADASLRVTDAAHQAARAATLARTATQAMHDAHATAQQALATTSITCRTLHVSADLRGFRPGGTVTVTVTCTVGLADLALLALPGTKAVSATGSSIVDIWRGILAGSAGVAPWR